MLNGLKKKFSKAECRLIVELLPPELYQDDGDCYYWAAIPSDGLLKDIVADFSDEHETIFGEFDVPLVGNIDDIRLLISNEKNFPMNAPIVTNEKGECHFVTARGMELRWKLNIPENETSTRVLWMEKIGKGEYRIVKCYKNHK